jgi:hypothetical protein
VHEAPFAGIARNLRGERPRAPSAGEGARLCVDRYKCPPSFVGLGRFARAEGLSCTSLHGVFLVPDLRRRHNGSPVFERPRGLMRARHTTKGSTAMHELLTDAHRTRPDSIWGIFQMCGFDGACAKDAAAGQGWRTVSSWGLRGRELGKWPYMVVFHREQDDEPRRFELVEYVEGHAATFSYDTQDERTQATDAVAFDYWRRTGAEWVADVPDLEHSPRELRGAFHAGTTR